MAGERRDTLGRPLQVAFCTSVCCSNAICGCNYCKEKEITQCEECPREWKCKIRVIYPHKETLVSALKVVQGRYGDLRYHYKLAKSICAVCCGEIESWKRGEGHCPASRHL